MNLQSFVATTAAVSLGLAAAGAGTLALRDRPPARPAVTASVEPAPAPAEGAPRADLSAIPLPPPPPPQVAPPVRRQLAQAAPHRHPPHEHARTSLRSVRVPGSGDEPRQVVVVPPGYYPAYAWRPSQGYYRAW